jgi:hypothetical protein
LQRFIFKREHFPSSHCYQSNEREFFAKTGLIARLKLHRNRFKRNFDPTEIKNRWELIELQTKKFGDQELAGSTE